ncbi:MAG: hypothetical protein ARM1_0843 [Candidatus Micrarchaeota archaeon]|nr:MAG: hypothetical protein ARM1_0843 [Candidatus Micrarchaeota archaeon]
MIYKKRGFVFTLTIFIIFIIIFSLIITYALQNILLSQSLQALYQLRDSSSSYYLIYSDIRSMLTSAIYSAVADNFYYPINSTTQYLIANSINQSMHRYTENLSKQLDYNISIINQSIAIYQNRFYKISVIYNAMLYINQTDNLFIKQLHIEDNYTSAIALQLISIKDTDYPIIPADAAVSFTIDPKNYTDIESSSLSNIVFLNNYTPLLSTCVSGCSNTSSSASFYVLLNEPLKQNQNLTLEIAFLKQGISNPYNRLPSSISNYHVAVNLSTFEQLD